MAGLVPAIHDLNATMKVDVDARHKAGHDAMRSDALATTSYSSRAWNVLQLEICPLLSPVVNQRWRCADEPWVKLSGTT